MWEGKTVSIVFPAYNEEENIRKAIEDFAASPYVDEVIVVDNNSTDKTQDEIKKTRAILVFESAQGFGNAVQRGLRETKGDYIILAEPDGTFAGKDTLKLLSYSDDFDVVLGTRTSKDLIWSGANMGFGLKWGNWFVAKMLEFLFNGPSMTDMGCSLRLVKREALKKFIDKFTVGGSYFLAEMTVLAILSGAKVVEVPVNYLPRIGKSKITGSKWRTIKVGFNMVMTILKYRINNLGKR